MTRPDYFKAEEQLVVYGCIELYLIVIDWVCLGLALGFGTFNLAPSDRNRDGRATNGRNSDKESRAGRGPRKGFGGKLRKEFGVNIRGKGSGFAVVDSGISFLFFRSI